MSEGLDLFGGHAIEDIPETNDLPAGVYPQGMVDTAKCIKSEKGPHGIAFNFKDISDEGFGLSAFQWLGIPAAPDKAQYLLRDLKAVGLKGEQLIAIARCVNGTDPDTAEVDINGINEVLSDVVGNNGTISVTEYTVKKGPNAGNKGHNIKFELNDDGMEYHEVNNFEATPKPVAQPVAAASTEAWFG